MEAYAIASEESRKANERLYGLKSEFWNEMQISSESGTLLQFLIDCGYEIDNGEQEGVYLTYNGSYIGNTVLTYLSHEHLPTLYTIFSSHNEKIDNTKEVEMKTSQCVLSLSDAKSATMTLDKEIRIEFDYNYLLTKITKSQSINDLIDALETQNKRLEEAQAEIATLTEMFHKKMEEANDGGALLPFFIDCGYDFVDDVNDVDTEIETDENDSSKSMLSILWDDFGVYEYGRFRLYSIHTSLPFYNIKFICRSGIEPIGASVLNETKAHISISDAKRAYLDEKYGETIVVFEFDYFSLLSIIKNQNENNVD